MKNEYTNILQRSVSFEFNWWTRPLPKDYRKTKFSWRYVTFSIGRLVFYYQHHTSKL